MSYPVFKDFDKSTTDLINDDFDNKYSLKVKSSGPYNSTLTTNTTWSAKDNNQSLVPKLSLKWSHESGFNLEKLEISQDCKLNVETSLNNIAPKLKVEFKGNDTDKADLSFNYSIPQATFHGEVDVHNLSGLKLSALGGQGAFTAGAAAEVKLGKSASSIDQTVFHVGLGYTIPKLVVGARACKNFSHYSATASYDATKELQLAGKVNYNSKETSAALVSIYKCCPNTTVKVKADSTGVFSASIKQAFEKKFTVVGSAEIPSNFNSVKFGLNATLG